MAMKAPLLFWGKIRVAFNRIGFRAGLRGGQGQSNPSFYSKFHFHGNFWLNLIDWGRCIYPKYSHFLFLILIFSTTSPFFYLYITKTNLFKYTENFTTKNWKFQTKILTFFHISDQNIDCGYSLEPPRRGGSNEYPQSMFLSRNKKNNVYPCKPQFYYIKVGFKGVKII